MEILVDSSLDIVGGHNLNGHLAIFSGTVRGPLGKTIRPAAPNCALLQMHLGRDRGFIGTEGAGAELEAHHALRLFGEEGDGEGLRIQSCLANRERRIR